MKRLKARVAVTAVGVAVTAALLGWLLSVQPRATVIVQARDIETAVTAVTAAGGEVTHELKIIRAVAARLTAEQISRLSVSSDLDLYENVEVELLQPLEDTWPGDRLGVEKGAVVAVVDTCDFVEKHGAAERPGRLLARYDARRDRPVPFDTAPEQGARILETPDVLVVVEAFDDDGLGTYADVIRGLDWVVRNRDTYGIGAASLDLTADSRSRVPQDPLRQAVVAVLQAGVGVVGSDGR